MKHLNYTTLTHSIGITAIIMGLIYPLTTWQASLKFANQTITLGPPHVPLSTPLEHNLLVIKLLQRSAQSYGIIYPSILKNVPPFQPSKDAQISFVQALYSFLNCPVFALISVLLLVFFFFFLHRLGICVLCMYW